MSQPQKMFINNTPYTIQGIISVRAGNNPGTEWGVQNFTLAPGPGSQQMVQYGDANDPYVDQLTLTADSNGAVVTSDQMVLIRSTPLDNLFNQNDTAYIAMESQSFVVTTGNTWTVKS